MRSGIWWKVLGLAMVGVMLFAALTGCGATPDEEPENGNTEEEPVMNSEKQDTTEEWAAKIQPSFIQEMDGFAVALLQQEVKQKWSAETNLLISPLSVYEALAMTTNGAVNGTLEEMQSVLGGDLTREAINQNMQWLRNLLHAHENGTSNIANGIWTRSGVEMREEFLKTVKQYYDAETHTGEFDEKTKDEINQWVKKKTDGMIDSLLEDAPSGMCHLINAIAFQGIWEEPYKDYQIDEERHFTNGKQEEEPVTMLLSEEGFYTENDDFQGFLKPYAKGEYYFMGLLPKGESLSDLEEAVGRLDGAAFSDLFQQAQGVSVEVALPEFTYRYGNDLKPGLQYMGIDLAFTDDADFSEMSETPLKIDAVQHKSYIKVDREGTKAAAVTDVAMELAMAMPEEEEIKRVELDRPFLYAIVEGQTGAPLFLGVVTTMTESL